MNFETTMLRDVSQTQKGRYYLLLFVLYLQEQTRRDIIEQRLSGAEGSAMGSYCFVGTELLFKVIN